MNKLPIFVCEHIYDFVSGDAVYWRTEFNKVIHYLNKYEDDVVSDMDRIVIYDATYYVDLFVFNILKISSVMHINIYDKLISLSIFVSNIIYNGR
jgi:hypothetical protein